MPKIDPITGCTVMTTGEFWKGEAEREGKGREPWELEQEMYNQLDSDMRTEEERIRGDKAGALKLIQKYLSEDPDDSLSSFGFSAEDIEEVLEIDSANVRGGFRESGASFQARVLLKDQTTRTLEYSEWHSSGSFYSPPDEETTLKLVAENGVPFRRQFDRERTEGWPICEACQVLGSTHLHGPMHWNKADYLVPLSKDQGATIERFAFVCAPHKYMWKNTIDWKGPTIRLKQDEPATLAAQQFRQKTDAFLDDAMAKADIEATIERIDEDPFAME